MKNGEWLLELIMVSYCFYNKIRILTNMDLVETVLSGHPRCVGTYRTCILLTTYTHLKTRTEPRKLCMEDNVWIQEKETAFRNIGEASLAFSKH